ncbi:hypothetical protein SSX86_016022 [Deinandra increscens subsp. villosa]|uniref:Uncharacterized protein n=1 Tax=Deinandra increscens subsp. villosa TaxID=3103831 RepID=A0AAP0D1W3_9ASTR
MPFKISHILSFLLCLYLLLNYLEFSTATATIIVHHHFSACRKMLASEFNFAPYLKNHHYHHHHHHHHQKPTETRGVHYDIDPRYGIEKRLVPSGPNPLHH